MKAAKTGFHKRGDLGKDTNTDKQEADTDAMIHKELKGRGQKGQGALIHIDHREERQRDTGKAQRETGERQRDTGP